MDDQRDYAEEAANRVAMEREGREEYAAEQRTKPLAVRLAEFCETDQARFLSLIHDAFDVATVMNHAAITRAQLISLLSLALGNAEAAPHAYVLNPSVTS